MQYHQVEAVTIKSPCYLLLVEIFIWIFSYFFKIRCSHNNCGIAIFQKDIHWTDIYCYLCCLNLNTMISINVEKNWFPGSRNHNMLMQPAPFKKTLIESMRLTVTSLKSIDFLTSLNIYSINTVQISIDLIAATDIVATLSSTTRAYGGYVIKITSKQSRLNQLFEGSQLYKFRYPKLWKPEGLAFL